MTTMRNGQVIHRLVRKFRSRLITNSWERTVFHLRHEFPADFALRQDTLTLNRLSLTIPRRSFGFLLDAYRLAVELHEKSAQFYLRDNLLLITVGGVTLSLKTAEEIFIVHEVFFRGVYGFDVQSPCSVIDVGMNVGVASLYFASQSYVSNVFSFEPFEPTYRQAVQNIELNPELAGKIVTANIGLGPKDETLDVAYDYANKGQVGIHGTALIRAATTEVENQRIALKRTSTVLADVIAKCGDSHLVLKLDCEGSEYGIVEDLAERGLLGEFSTIMIEWHERGPELLLASLRQAGYTSFFQHASTRVGMIYAAK